MCSIKLIVYSLIVICTVQSQYGNGIVQESRDAQRIKKGSLFIGKNSFDKGNLLFAVCEKNTTSATNCNVVQKVYPNSQSTYSCFITIKGDYDESRLNFRIGVATLGKDKAILYWGEEYNDSLIAKVGTVDLKTCKMNHISIPDPSKEVLLNLMYTDKIVAYSDDSFDLFYNDSKQCHDKLCRIQIHANGTVKGDPIVSDIPGGMVHYVSPIASRSSSKGYVYLKKDPMEYNLSIVKADGTTNQLSTYVNTARPTVSVSNDIISACTKPSVDSDVICTQYDEDGQVKFMTTIPEIYKNSQPRALTHLPDGGILVLLAEFSNCDYLQNCDEGKYHMVKIDKNGKYIGNAPIRDFDNVNNQWKYTFVYKFDESKYCACIIGQDPVIDNLRLSNFEIIHNCVTEKDFSA
ncbi:uncharacterized protein LOC131669949 [Phymastichus coffea]|uniref:uncharacterized protein LOC131669949 n=1 Tax=Phymastichus coffea TaxID=108790 RepID=UPI00273CAA37|nr:uncharacterized protein LOC131669949 [Phymastichus coffea]